MFYTSIKIPSDLSQLYKIEGFIDSTMQDCSIEECYRGIISLPLIEAVKNAIIHGNHLDKHKTVKIICQEECKKITFSISDEGIGFPYEASLKSAEYKGKHGLSIIKKLSEDISFRDNGATIMFSLAIPAVIKISPICNLNNKVFEKYKLKTS